MIEKDRLTEVEIKLAEQERLVDELSSVLAEQWKTIDQMDKKLTALTKRFLELEEQSQPDIPVTRPPHW
ncbi:SlyX family protein [Bartonella sp. B10834G6]|uniref:Protein SlyX homolog n=1 Tax=Bartonella apis TaxID=1686310 RepID=A0A1R0FCI7_9HYPH|nr:SlyX family protein [Bartonella apis]MBI0169885.1 SlyX family protein [Bartonella sp. W8167]MBI0171287.1 SlyX family protein [Bartonella sp. W8151]MBH9981782.1 SlyX family protein [Bartonella apis]MBH9986663.1 SlyX family protein [Bartonella apis]MBI0176137.1 SlyX family protein [Bartonella apis]